MALDEIEPRIFNIFASFYFAFIFGVGAFLLRELKLNCLTMEKLKKRKGIKKPSLVLSWSLFLVVYNVLQRGHVPWFVRAARFISKK